MLKAAKPNNSEPNTRLQRVQGATFDSSRRRPGLSFDSPKKVSQPSAMIRPTSKPNSRTGQRPKGPNLNLPGTLALLEAVTVSVAVPLLVTDVGLIEHVVPVKVEPTLHVNATEPVKLLSAATFMLAVP